MNQPQEAGPALAADGLMPRLLLATNNLGKIGEYRQLLADCGWELVTLADLGLTLDEEEVGDTYEDNARMKAGRPSQGQRPASPRRRLRSRAWTRWAARPGPRSARFGGERDQRPGEGGPSPGAAEGRCRPRDAGAASSASSRSPSPQGEVRLCRGRVRGPGGRGAPRRGRLRLRPHLLPAGARADHGGAASAEEKNAISHRGRAARQASAAPEGAAP